MEQKNRSKYHSEISPRADRSKIESPLEELFIEQFEKYLSGKVDIISQYEVNTNAGKFRLDFVIESDKKKIGIECDGKEFHNEWRDEWRDALILGSNQVDTIYRFRGKDLACFINDCIHIIYHYDKEIFNERYSQIYNQLITNDLKEYINSNPSFKDETNRLSVRTTNEDGHETGGWMQIIVERRNKNNRESQWNVLYEFSKQHPGLNIDQIITEREKSWTKF